MDTSVPLTVRYVDSSLDESVGNDAVIAANESINAMVSFNDLLWYTKCSLFSLKIFDLL